MIQTSLLFRMIFTFTPLVALLLMPWEQLNMGVITFLVFFGVMFLAVPIGAVVSIMTRIEKHADEIIEEIRKY